MDLRTEIRNAPRAMRETLEKGRPEYEALVRQIRWGDGTVYMVGSGSSYVGALTGARAFEELLGWPVVARRAADFSVSSASLIRPRSVLLAISPAGESDATLEAAREARSRGAVLLAVTANPDSPLAEMADGVFLLRTGEGPGGGITAVLCLQAALGYLGLVAARSLKRHHQKLDDLEKDFEKLPAQAEWVLNNLSDAARALAAELKGLAAVLLVGGGFYYPAALHAAHFLNHLTPVRAEAKEATELLEETSTAQLSGTVLFLSSSRCRMRRAVHACAKSVKGAGGKVIAVTDSNDRELSNAAGLAVLLPLLFEMPGSTLSLLFLQWLACCLARGEGTPEPPSGRIQ